MVGNFPSLPLSSLKKPSSYTSRACWWSTAATRGAVVRPAENGARGHERPLSFAHFSKKNRLSALSGLRTTAPRRRGTQHPTGGKTGTNSCGIDNHGAPPAPSCCRKGSLFPGRRWHAFQTCCLPRGSQRRHASATSGAAETTGERVSPCGAACRRCSACWRCCWPASTRRRRLEPGGTAPCGARRTFHPVVP